MIIWTSFHCGNLDLRLGTSKTGFEHARLMANHKDFMNIQSSHKSYLVEKLHFSLFWTSKITAILEVQKIRKMQFYDQVWSVWWNLKLYKTLLIILGWGMLKSSFWYSESQITISIMQYCSPTRIYKCKVLSSFSYDQ